MSICGECRGTKRVVFGERSEPCGACAPDLPHFLSLGAGVQSSTLALMAAAGEITPMPKCAIFADTQAEPDEVYRWLDWLEKQLPFPVVRVTREGVSLEESESTTRVSKRSGMTYRRSLIPAFTKDGGLLIRKCTRDYKIDPITRTLRRLAKIPRACKEVRLVQWIGISTDEAIV